MPCRRPVAQRAAMMGAGPSMSRVVPEPDFVLEFLVTAPDAPARFGDVNQLSED